MSYRDLKSYQQAAIIYDFTVEFCNRFVDKTYQTDKSYKTYRTNKSYRSYSRMSDQMIQAARSGKQNIVEGSSERTSEKSELKLLGVARASLQELLEDYEDFLRQRNLEKWDKNDPRALEIRNLYKSNKSNQSDKSNRSYKTYKSYLNSPEGAANAAICLINQANFLLDRQISACENEFVSKGGYTENLSRKRNEEIKKKFIGIELRKHE